MSKMPRKTPTSMSVRFAATPQAVKHSTSRMKGILRFLGTNPSELVELLSATTAIDDLPRCCHT